MHGINRPNLVCLNHLTFPIYINKFYKKVMELAIMKNAGWQSIGFLLLIFILTVGLSYLAFNENSSEVDNEERRMSIALVNEDEGRSEERRVGKECRLRMIKEEIEKNKVIEFAL